jgi:spore coat polysaccharide biosynthesis protein SpsF
MRTVAIIQARMTSTRLPGKILSPILGKPMLELLIERLRRASRLDDIWVATTVNAADNPTEELARRLGAGCFRGSELDVLDRVLKAAHTSNADVIVEITGDCPLIDPGVVDQIVETFQNGQFDYVSNVLRRTYPRGLDTQVYSTKVLERVASLTDDPVDHEHVSIYIYSNPDIFKLQGVESGLPDAESVGKLRLTVDTPEDFALIKAIYEELYPSRQDFRLGDVLGLLERRPELRSLNAHIQQKRSR